MKLLTKFFIFITLFITLSANASMNKEEVINNFIIANQAYEKQEYNKALTSYQKLVTEGVKNSTIYFNLGNCYLKVGNNSQALANYLKAKALAPRDNEITANLTYVLKKTGTKDNLDNENNIFLKVFFWYNFLNLEESIILFLFFWSLLWIAITTKRFFTNELLKVSIYAFSFLILILGTTLSLKIYDYMNPKAVVIVKESEVKTENNESSLTLFKVNNGTILKISDRLDNWIKVELSNEKRGWIQKSSIEEI